MYRLSNRSFERLNGVHPILIATLSFAIENSPYDFAIAYDGGRRTAERQHELYLTGRSKKDGYNKKSKHQYGLAIDFIVFDKGNVTWEVDKMEAVAKHIKKVGFDKFGVILRWGGDWDMDGVRVDLDPNERFLDAGHIEIYKILKT